MEEVARGNHPQTIFKIELLQTIRLVQDTNPLLRGDKMEEGFTLTPIPPDQLPTFDEFWDDLKEDARLYLDKDDSIYEKGTHGIPPRPAKIVEYVYKHGGRLGTNFFLRGFVRQTAIRAGLSGDILRDLDIAAYWNFDDTWTQLHYDTGVDILRNRYGWDRDGDQ